MTKNMKKLIQKKFVFDKIGTNGSGFEYHRNDIDDKSIDHLRPTRLKPLTYLININSINKKISVITEITESSTPKRDKKKYDIKGRFFIMKQTETGLRNDFGDRVPGIRETS